MWPPGYFFTCTRVGVAHRRHLVDDQHRSHERAGQIVPAVGDQHAQVRVVGHRLAQLRDRSLVGIVVLVPQAVHLVAQRVVAGIDLPAHGLGDEVDHRAGGRGDDAVEDRVAGLLVRRVGERIPRGDVGVVAAAQAAFGAVDLAQIGLGLQPAAGALHEQRIESGQFGHLA